MRHHTWHTRLENQNQDTKSWRQRIAEAQTPCGL
jgi:hypothetical protein